jgi:class 3 adenylate cyclase
MADERTQRRLAAIVCADVAGYSRLMERDESGTLAALKSYRAKLIDPLVEEHGGRIVKTTGDGLLLEFPALSPLSNARLSCSEGWRSVPQTYQAMTPFTFGSEFTSAT